MRDQSSDYGIDCEIEVVAEGQVTGALVKVQVKGTSGRKEGLPQSVSVNTATVRYWMALPVPVILVQVRTSPAVVQWIDVRSALCERRRELTSRKTCRFSFRRANSLPDDITALESLAKEHQALVANSYALGEDSAVPDFIGYVLLITVHHGNPDDMIAWLRRHGSLAQLRESMPFALWVKEQATADPTLLPRVRAMVEDFLSQGTT